MSETDHELMNRLCTGQTECLGDLYDRHGAAVLRHCSRMAGGDDAARDLTQEVFLRVFRYRNSFEGRSKFSTWLYRITRNVCLDYLEQIKKRPDSGQPVAGDHWTEDPDSRTGPSQRIEERQTIARLDASLARLSPAYREIIMLIRYQDMSYEEVSRVLDCTVNAARVRFHRAIAALRDEFNKSGRTGE